MKSCLTLLAVIIGGFICLAIIAVVIGMAKAGHTLVQNDQQAKSVTARIGQVRMGMSEPQVVAILGKPETTSDMQMVGTDRLSCIYYGVLSTDSWQLCFDNGRLNAKNRN
jgi:hypothetical protein